MDKSIKVMMYNANKAPTINTVFPWFKIENTGDMTVNLSDIKVQYYFNKDGEGPLNFWCDWSDKDASNVTGKFIKMSCPKPDADCYLEIGFSSAAGSLKPGESVEIQSRFAKLDWSNYNQENHYSFNPSATSYIPWDKVSAYVKGGTTWGTSPIKVIGVALNKLNRIMLKGESKSLTAAIIPSDSFNKKVIWESSNADIITVTQEGVVSAIDAGLASIIVTTAEGSYNATCDIAVCSSLVGRIKDAFDGTFISGARIGIYDNDNTEIAFGRTNAEGTYSINLVPGEYMAVATSDNYITATSPVKVESRAVTNNIELNLVPNLYTETGTL